MTDPQTDDLAHLQPRFLAEMHDVQLEAHFYKLLVQEANRCNMSWCALAEVHSIMTPLMLTSGFLLGTIFGPMLNGWAGLGIALLVGLPLAIMATLRLRRAKAALRGDRARREGAVGVALKAIEAEFKWRQLQAGKASPSPLAQ